MIANLWQYHAVHVMNKTLLRQCANNQSRISSSGVKVNRAGTLTKVFYYPSQHPIKIHYQFLYMIPSHYIKLVHDPE